VGADDFDIPTYLRRTRKAKEDELRPPWGEKSRPEARRERDVGKDRRKR
jgi:hypothetical protein